MSTAGLAQFTHAGKVSSGTTVDLTVRLDQVDDLLKSLTIFDEQGSIGAVSLPGKAPLTELFRDLPFGPDALNSLPDLLNAMVGADVDIDGTVSASGRLLRVTEQTVTLPNNGGQTTRHRLTLMTENGMVQAVMEELSARALHRSGNPGADREGARRASRQPRQGPAQAVDQPARLVVTRRRPQLCGRRAGLEDRLPAGAAEDRRTRRGCRAGRWWRT